MTENCLPTLPNTAQPLGHPTRFTDLWRLMASVPTWLTRRRPAPLDRLCVNPHMARDLGLPVAGPPPHMSLLSRNRQAF